MDSYYFWYFFLIAAAQTAKSLNSSGITTVSDEHLINLINYTEFASHSLVSVASYSASLNSSIQNFRQIPPSPTPSPVLPSSPPPTPQSSNIILFSPDQTASNTKKNGCTEQPLTKRDVACNTSCTNIGQSRSRENFTSYENVNWIPMLEMAKSDFIKLIDNHINTIREKAEQTQSKQYEWLHALQMSQARKFIARKSCVRRIREEFTTKMSTFHILLDQLEHI